jgi:hypothetical protein
MVEHKAEKIRASTSGGVLELIRSPSLETIPHALICPTCIRAVNKSTSSSFLV